MSEAFYRMHWADCPVFSAANAYSAERGDTRDDDGEIVVFDGQQVGTGFDSEPLVVPIEVTARMCWTSFANYSSDRMPDTPKGAENV